MLTLVIFIAVLAVIVLTHEFGHFIVARRSGMKVDEFGFGFPPRLIGIRRIKNVSTGKARWHIVWGSRAVEQEVAKSEHVPGTVYSINWLPFGGFVKIKGEDGGSYGATDHDSFAGKKPWQKALVLVAGVGMNVLTAWILFSVVFMVGFPQAGTDATSGAQVSDQRIEIIEVLPGKPAAAAGFEPGDQIVSVAGAQNDVLQNPHLTALQDFINAHKDSDLTVTALRGKDTISKTVHPIVYPDTGRAGIGVAIIEMSTVRYPWYRAIYYGGQNTMTGLKEIAKGFGQLFVGLFKGSVSSGVSGPVGVAVVTGQVARLGLVYLLQFIALLSLNLAFLNILPIPALDGGRLLFVIINKITRRPISVRAEQLAHTIGFAALMLLVVAVTAHDLWMFTGAISSWFHRAF